MRATCATKSATVRLPSSDGGSGSHDLADCDTGEPTAQPACCSSAVAALTTNQPINASHTPPSPLPVTSCNTPRAIIAKPTKRPARAALTAAVCRLPCDCHKAARKTRPPSSGAAGMRLNTRASHWWPRGTSRLRTEVQHCPAMRRQQRRGRSRRPREGSSAGPRWRYGSPPRESSLPPQLCNATKKPQHNALHLDAVTAGD